MKLLNTFLLVLTGFLARSQSTTELINEAGRLSEQKKYREAISILDKVLKMDTANYRAYVGRGNVYNNLDSMQDAFNDYTKAISLQPDSALAYHHRAILFFRLLYTEEAIDDNTKAIELTTDDTLRLMCYGNRGNAKQQKRDFQGAYEDYSRAYLLDTSNITTLNNMATSLDELGRRDEAIGYFKRIIRLDPQFLGGHINLGFQYSKMGKYKEAVACFNNALAIQKDEPIALNNRGFAKYKLNDLAGALADINRSILLYPANSYAYKNRALVYIAQNKKELACHDIQTALDYEFTKVYGDEVKELQAKYCKK